MRPSLVAQLPLALVVLGLVCTQSSSSYSLDRFLTRRQSEAEQEESTSTPKSETTNNINNNNNNNQATPVAQPSPRLYPDLPRQPNFIPAFNAPPSAVANGYQQLIPFGLGPMPNGQRLNADQQPAPFGRMPATQPRHMTPAERLASQSFADGLGRRLMSLVGINTGNSSDKSSPPVAESRADEPNGGMIGNEQPADETTKALQNATVLQQLHKGLNSIYGNLSKMYNSTVQEQLAMLQERFKSETANSTNPWHQRMAERVPMFFKQMASRVGEAQEQLNRAWHEVATANTSTPPQMPNVNPQIMRARSSIFGQFDPFASAGDYEFMNQFNRQFNFNGNPQQQQNVSSAQAMAARVQQLWTTQVQPRVSYVRNQIVRAWRDLPGMSSDPMIHAQSQAPLNSANSSSADLVDSILKEVDIGPTSEYSLVEPKSDGGGGESSEEKPATTTTTTANKDTGTGLKLNPEMQARLYQVQRDLNQLWMGLANSLQGAIANVQRTLNPRPQFAGPFEPMVREGSMASGQQQAEANPALNEIDDKIKSLSKVQRDADMVNEALLQQQRETQQRQTFGDRFRGFFNNVDMNQLPDRIGEQFNRFGNAVGNFWNQIPNRWDDFVTQVRPPPQDRMRPASSTTTTTTTTTAPASERK